MEWTIFYIEILISQFRHRILYTAASLQFVDTGGGKPLHEKYQLYPPCFNTDLFAKALSHPGHLNVEGFSSVTVTRLILVLLKPFTSLATHT